MNFMNIKKVLKKKCEINFICDQLCKLRVDFNKLKNLAFTVDNRVGTTEQLKTKKFRKEIFKQFYGNHKYI